MRVAVIGAGLSGLAAAQRLRAYGHEVTVFEKSRGVGGRLATRRTDAGPVDHGCPVLDAPAGSALREVLDGPATCADPMPELLAPSAVDGFALEAPFWCPDGVTAACKRLADGLDIALGTRIAVLRPDGDRVELGDEQGNGHGHADAVVVSAPAPQAADLLGSGDRDPARVAALRAIAYRPAIVAILAVAGPPPGTAQIVHPSAGPAVRIVAMPRGGAEVHAITVTLDPVVSAELLDAGTDAQIVARARSAVAAQCGMEPDVAWAQVKRWRYAVTAPHAGRAALNPPGARVLLCGDAVAPGGLANVYASGLTAAERVAVLA